MELLFATSRSAAIRLFDGGKYHTLKPHSLFLNGKPFGETSRTITSLWNLLPDTEYTVEAKGFQPLRFRTAKESVSLDVRRFGAKGDGLGDDTAALQTAILCCPENGRVRIPAGDYLTGPLFLKSHITIEFQQGARLLLHTDRSRFPVLPGSTLTPDGEYLLGSWEGNPLDSFASAITGVEVEDVRLIGPGVIDGQAPLSDWWHNPKIRRGAWRPRLLFLTRCQNITVQGLTFQNSPAWNLQPHFSSDLIFADIRVTAPANSPNTDGFDPESCRNVLLTGAHFSLGDDCIAIKSGKIYMGAKYRTPCENIDITHCLMENGHGGVTIGSEMAGGVNHVRVRHCLMRNTDRGLRVKTRRGRGEQGVIDEIAFDHVDMDHVGAPFVVNAMYFCDPDGHTPYVQSRDAQPADHRTPRIGRVSFRHVKAQSCGACAGYFLGLPEKPIECLAVEDSSFTFDPSASPMQPAMADGVEPCLNQGLIAHNVSTIVWKNVTMQGQEGPVIRPMNVQSIQEDNA